MRPRDRLNSRDIPRAVRNLDNIGIFKATAGHSQEWLCYPARSLDVANCGSLLIPCTRFGWPKKHPPP